MDIGIGKKEQEKIAEGCRAFWRIPSPVFEDPQFPLERHRPHVQHAACDVHGPVHRVWNALDLIAERIRALGVAAPGTYQGIRQARSSRKAKARSAPRT